MSSVISCGGVRWYVREGRDDFLVSDAHEPGLLEFLVGNGNPTFVDVGAHVGKYTLRLAGVFERVAALEPNEENRKALLANVALNRARNVDVLPFAAWRCWEPVLLSDENAQSRVGSDGTKVTGMPLDSLFARGEVGLVKVDVEGAEAAVLDGMARILATDRPRLVIEMHDETHDAPEILTDVAARLRSAGYRWDDAYRHGPSHYWVADPEEKP